MTDAEDKEKAAKVAAARKRYEQLKKKKAGGGKKAEDKADPVAAEAAHDEDADGDKDDEEAVDTKGSDGRSLATESHERSESFKQGLTSPGLKPSPPSLGGDSADAVADVYKRQVARIQALEDENKKLLKGAQDKERLEAELEELREKQGEESGLKKKADKAGESGGEVERLKAEVSSLRRQITTLQSPSKRRPSTSDGSTEDLHAQLQAKQSTIEALELDLSNLRHSLFQSSSETSDLSARISQLEASLATSQSEAQSLQTDLTALRAEKTPANLNKEDPQTTIQMLTTQLGTATSRVATLEKKVETLSSLHRDSEARNSTQSAARLKEMERLRLEAADMRKKLQTKSHENARLRASSVSSSHVHSLSLSHSRGPSSNLLPGEELIEDQVLRARIRELEEENAALRRGEHGETGGIFDDVDLSPPAVERLRAMATPYAYGALTNVSNMISTFTGAASGRRQSGSAARGGFFDSVPAEGEEDDEMAGFNEDAFRAAAEEEARKRLERVRETKRGLVEWKGYRLDLVELRGGEMAGVFEV